MTWLLAPHYTHTCRSHFVSSQAIDPKEFPYLLSPITHLNWFTSAPPYSNELALRKIDLGMEFVSHKGHAFFTGAMSPSHDTTERTLSAYPPAPA